MSKQIRILIADDHEVVRRGLVLVLRQEPDLAVVAEAKDGVEAVSLIYDCLPDVAVLDWKMPRMDGLAAAFEMKQNIGWIRTLILSGAPVEAEALDALDKGVDGFVHKDITPASLAFAIREVAAGKRYLGQEIMQALLEYSRRRFQDEPTPVGLSTREQEVLELMATAVTYKEMAVKLKISDTTVHTYVKRIFTKLSQPNRTQAVIAALRLGLISAE
jgi:DNA-binding NarL/FixJ family response regulator